MADRIAIASDHAAVALKAVLAAWLEDAGHQVTDLGPYDTQSVDYPDYGYALAEEIAAERADVGIALCGSGIGISIAVNRHPAAGCGLVGGPGEGARAPRPHAAHGVAQGARLLGEDMAKACVDAFLSTPFEGGRHARRVAKLSQSAKEPA